MQLPEHTLPTLQALTSSSPRNPRTDLFHCRSATRTPRFESHGRLQFSHRTNGTRRSELRMSKLSKSNPGSLSPDSDKVGSAVHEVQVVRACVAQRPKVTSSARESDRLYNRRLGTRGSIRRRSGIYEMVHQSHQSFQAFLRSFLYNRYSPGVS